MNVQTKQIQKKRVNIKNGIDIEGVYRGWYRNEVCGKQVPKNLINFNYQSKLDVIFNFSHARGRDLYKLKWDDQC